MSHSSLLKSFVVSTVLLQVLVASAPTSPVSGLQQPLINKEILNSADTSSEDDSDVEELHKLGWASSKNGVSNTTPAQPLVKEAPVKGDEKRTVQSELINELNSATKDTPRDMAEYIFWTGDEEGVMAAVKDFVVQGMMTEVEAITFLEEVRYDLNQMRLRFGNSVEASVAAERSSNSPQKNKYTVEEDKDDREDEDEDNDEVITEIKAIAPKKPVKVIKEKVEKPIQEQQVRNQEPEKHQGEIVVTSFNAKEMATNIASSTQPEAKAQSIEEIKSKPIEANKDNNKEQLGEEESQLAELVSNEYSLEEIIYQLARILFSQSLSQVGNPEAEEALKKFADFLEKESHDGKMSPQLQKKVLDVLLMSLFDAMGDQGQHASFSVSKFAADLEKKNLLPEKH